MHLQRNSSDLTCPDLSYQITLQGNLGPCEKQAFGHPALFFHLEHMESVMDK